MSDIPQKSPRKRKSRAGKSLKNINLDQIQKKLLNVLERETNQLLVLSVDGKLDKDQSDDLNKYLKLLKELRKQEAEELSEMSEEELEKLADKK
jgi:hypothetical protein